MLAINYIYNIWLPYIKHSYEYLAIYIDVIMM